MKSITMSGEEFNLRMAATKKIGYMEGRAAGQIEAWTTGQNTGYDKGYDVGYDAGYLDCLRMAATKKKVTRGG